MARQLTVRIPSDLENALALASSKQERSLSEIVRQALRLYLQRPREGQRPFQRVSHLIGSIESGVPDLAEKHREYLLESLKDGQ